MNDQKQHPAIEMENLPRNQEELTGEEAQAARGGFLGGLISKRVFG